MADEVATATFRCGHLKVPENMAKNGTKLPPVCRTCKLATGKRYSQTEKGKISSKERDERHRRKKGMLPGHHASRKTACDKGHPFTKENTYRYRGWRLCKTCRYARSSEYHHNRNVNGGHHTNEKWEALCKSYGGRCARCREVRPLTRDHIIPVSCGGTNSIDNIQPLCKPCNSAKGTNVTDYGIVVVLT